MKRNFLICLLLMTYAHAETPATLLDPIAKTLPETAAPAPAQERLEVPPEDIISSKVVFRDGQKFTIQEIEPQEISPFPAGTTNGDLIRGQIPTIYNPPTAAPALPSPTV